MTFNRAGHITVMIAPSDTRMPTRPPDAFVCSITCEVMRNPTILRCGHSFEHGALAEWISGSPACPVCRYGATPADMIPNHALRQLIDGTEFIETSYV
jgi:hypothetical protein